MSTTRLEFVAPGATGYQLELLLRQYGIPVSGRSAQGNRCAFDVPASQAEWARYVLKRAGVLPVATDAEGHAEYARGSLPPAWGVGVKRRSLMTLWIDFLGTILGAPRREQWQAARQAKRQRATKRRGRR